MNGVRLVAGCMTGTSIDGIDAALVEVRGRGLEMRARFVRGVSRGLGELGAALRRLAGQEPMAAGAIAELAHEFSLLHAEVLAELTGESPPDLACIHGQTVFHRPPPGAVSWQLINAAPIARRLGAPVVFDLRAADVAAGGQGAPITPLADWVWFRDIAKGAVVNLGGFCNITLLEENPGLVEGRDVCACNHLLDGIARRMFASGYDEGGRRAGAGSVEEDACRELVLALSAGGRSLGTGDEGGAWVERWRGRISGEDLARTACAAIAERIAACARGRERVLLAGGGIHNAALAGGGGQAGEIAGRIAGRVERTDEHGLPAVFREAACMAVLGALCQDGVPITLPGATGVKAPPVAGCWVLGGAGAAHRDTERRTAHPPAPHHPPPDRAHLLTEQRNPRSMNLHAMSIAGCVRLMNEEDGAVIEALRRAEPSLVALIEAAEPGFAAGGRLVYIGAGTSGRLGVLDASEAPPTFQVPPGRVVGIIAGGAAALRRSSEGREDDPQGARDELDALALCARDTVIGIAAGGTTPYVLGGVAHAKRAGALTGLIVCAPVAGERPEEGVDHLVVLATGPEVLTGSTRLKAGTATKLALNTISTTLMARSGRVYQNLMVDLRGTNSKLRDRAARILAMLTGLERGACFELLERADGEVKTAVVMHRCGVDAGAARARLGGCGGRLDLVLEGPAR